MGTIAVILQLLKSDIGIVAVCLIGVFWILKLYTKNQKLEFEKSINNKASKEDIEELKEEIHKINIEIILLKTPRN